MCKRPQLDNREIGWEGECSQGFTTSERKRSYDLKLLGTSKINVFQHVTPFKCHVTNFNKFRIELDHFQPNTACKSALLDSRQTWREFHLHKLNALAKGRRAYRFQPCVPVTGWSVRCRKNALFRILVAFEEILIRFTSLGILSPWPLYVINDDDRDDFSLSWSLKARE